MPLSGANPQRTLATLQRLLEIPAADLRSALVHAANALAEALSAEKVDTFLYDELRDSLVAEGVSTQPLSDLQRQLGLDVLPVSNGGGVVRVFRSGKPLRVADVQSDAEELRGIKEGLRIGSHLGVPLFIGSQLRGVILVASLEKNFFTEADESFAVAAARWVGSIAHRAELSEAIERNALEQGRRAAAEELTMVLAHDVRNYVAPIAGRLYRLRHDAKERGEAGTLEHVEAALRSVSGLNALVSSLLEVARIDRGLFDLDVGPVELCELATEAAASLSTADHEIVVESSGAIVAAADRARLRQCLDNLFANAAAHSPRGAPVNVFVSSLPGPAACGQIEVIDEGPGIEPDILPHIFDRFVSGRTSEGGAGLGLYIASRIVRAHGGELTAESPPGKGARFVLRVPLYDEMKTVAD